MASTMSKTEFSNQLDSLTQLIDSMIMKEDDKSTMLDTISVLRGRVGELADASARASLISDLNAFIDSVVNSFKIADYNKIISKFYYAINSSDIFSIGRTAAELEAATADNKLNCIKNFMAIFNNITSNLKANNIATDDLNALTDHMNGFRAKRFDNATEKASDAMQELNELQNELAHARDEKEKEIVIKKIDKQISKLNSTNRTLSRLQKKVGKIGPHQHAVKVKASQITALRNQTIVDIEFNSDEINYKLDNLKQAYQRQANATTASEAFLAKRDIKRAEKEMYGRKLTRRRAEMIDDAIAERNSIIANARTIQTDDKREYRRQFKQTMKDLKRIDKKIIGKRNAEALYDNLRQKSGYLVGGTGLTLPKQVVELNTAIVNARR